MRPEVSEIRISGLAAVHQGTSLRLSASSRRRTQS
jgi:hypothetical protein